MKNIRFKLWLVAAMLCFGASSAWAKQVVVTLSEAGTISSKISESDKASIVNLKVVGPINSTDIKFIREMAKAGCKLDSLDLWDAQLRVGGEAYYADMGFKITKDNEIGVGMFAETNLVSVVLPSSATAAGKAALSYCTYLKSVTIGPEMTSFGSSMFASSTALRSITCYAINPPELTSNSVDSGIASKVTVSVQARGYDAYKAHSVWSKMKVQMLPGNMSVTLTDAGTLSEQIGDSKNSVTELKVKGPINGTDILYIREMAGCRYSNDDKPTTTEGKLTLLDLSEANIVAGGDNYNYLNGRYYSSTDNVVGHGMFCHTNLEYIILPQSATAIKNYPFYKCEKLKEVTMSDGITEVGSAAFAYCTSLEKIVLSENINDLDSYSFYHCESLSSVTLGKAMTALSTEVFSECTKLKTIVSHAVNPPSVWESFEGVSVSGISLYVTSEAAENYEKADVWKKMKIVLTDLVTTTSAGKLSENISDADKYTMTTLKVSGPINGADVKFIREMAGRDSQGAATAGKLYYLDLSEATIVASDDVYYTRTGGGSSSEADATAKPAEYDDATTDNSYSTADNEVGDYMFYQTNLTDIKLPASATKIGESALRETLVASVEVADGVTAIGADAFSGCASLKEVSLPETLTEIGESAFESCTSLQSVTIPEGVTEIAEKTFSGCTSLAGVYLSDNVKTIGASAYSGCSGVEWVNVGNGVTNISDNAFGGVTSLQRFTLRTSNPPTLGTAVFQNVSTKDATLYVPVGKIETYKTADAQWAAFGNFAEGIPTGIEDVEADDATEVARYDINGRQLSAPAAGINIVRMSDGTTRKQLVK